MRADIYFLAALFSFIFLLMVLNFVRRGRLKEQYAILWIFFGLILIVVSLRVEIIDWLAALLGVVYPPSLLFLLGIIFCLSLIVHLTVVVSRLEERVVRLTQEIALLRAEVGEGAKRKEEAAG
ncbi:MAG: hypothetical protein PWQ91_305 [Eubacteriales bacterium]|nr:hypothetical protein [Eubacteriales bacterium]